MTPLLPVRRFFSALALAGRFAPTGEDAASSIGIRDFLTELGPEAGYFLSLRYMHSSVGAKWAVSG